MGGRCLEIAAGGEVQQRPTQLVSKHLVHPGSRSRRLHCCKVNRIVLDHLSGSRPADNPLRWDSEFTSSGRGVVVCLHCSKFCPEFFVLFSFTVGCGASPSSMQALTATRSREVSMGVTNI